MLEHRFVSSTLEISRITETSVLVTRTEFKVLIFYSMVQSISGLFYWIVWGKIKRAGGETVADSGSVLSPFRHPSARAK